MQRVEVPRAASEDDFGPRKTFLSDEGRIPSRMDSGEVYAGATGHTVSRAPKCCQALDEAARKGAGLSVRSGFAPLLLS